MRSLILALFVLSVAYAAIANYGLKVGDKLELEATATEWKRTVQGQIQTTRLCKAGEKKNDCGNWVDKDGKIVASASKPIVSGTGKLTIAKVTKSDAGSYEVSQPKADSHVAPTLYNVIID